MLVSPAAVSFLLLIFIEPFPGLHSELSLADQSVHGLGWLKQGVVRLGLVPACKSDVITMELRQVRQAMQE